MGERMVTTKLFGKKENHMEKNVEHDREFGHFLLHIYIHA